MKKILLLTGLALSLWGSPALAQTSSANTAVVRIRETGGWGNVIVTYGTGKTEMSELQRSPGKKGQITNAEQLQGVLDKLMAAGYVLQGSFSSTDTSTLIFRKP
ncbi:hypothetical protein [Hymenobacter cellulosilyticus]|uniref:DUF4907 domain-containing protein n=1 Tax=Hymenobacter cellulosilyticus TaxID=2932248 RepID=A0A8T9QEP3_9BACT|nr:hypothetical protein [Hymenobacter cellulosilyticus]UOQ74019.1 hypothetical protein MUN79_09055 [Hymenobacter cellulosilyticus]